MVVPEVMRQDARSTRLGIWVALLALLVGCAHVVEPYSPGESPGLAADEGLFIVHVDTDVPVAEIELGSGIVGTSIQKGEHVWLVRLRAGSYRWSSVRLDAQAGAAQQIWLEDDDEFTVEIEAGQLNYAGAMIIRSPHERRSVEGNVRVRHRNHAAMAIRKLLERNETLVQEMVLHHGGSSGDRFLDYYQEMREEASADGTAGQ